MSLTKIAELAGVSIATVSRVVNNSRPVSPDIAAKVREVMKDLRFSASSLGRRGRPRESDNRLLNIAIVCVGMRYEIHFEMPVMSSVLGALLSAADDAMMNVTLTEMPNAEELSPVLRRPDLDGVLAFVAGDLPGNITDRIAACCPVVRVMGGQLGSVSVDYVTPDQTAIGYLAANYLVSHGCRRLGYLNTSPAWDFEKLRSQGFLAAAHSQGAQATSFIATDDQTLSRVYGSDAIATASLSDLVGAILEKKMDGVFVSRDIELAPVYRELAARGATPGQDFRIVSCDNEQVRLGMLHPRPVSIDLGAAEIAAAAVQRLAWRIQNPHAAAVKILVSPNIPEENARENPTTN